MGVIEGNQGLLLIGRQSAAGTPLDPTAAGSFTSTANAQRFYQLPWISGDFSVNRTDGKTSYPVYGQRFYSATDYVQSLIGEGTPVFAGTPTSIAQLCAWFLGVDTLTGASDPATHVATSPLTGGAGLPYLTVFKELGVNEGSGSASPGRWAFADSQITGLVIEGSSANPAVQVTATIRSANPGIVSSAPSVTTNLLSSDRGFNFHDGATTTTSSFKFSAPDITNTPVVVGSAHPGPTIGFRIEMAAVVNDVPSELAQPLGFTYGEVTLSAAVTFSANGDSLQLLNKIIYGSATPTAGTPATGAKPTSDIVQGALDITLTQAGAATTRDARFQIPLLKWTPQAEVPFSPDGSPVEIAMAAEGRVPASSIMGGQIITVTCHNGEVLHY
jgi:hypothetical protein